MGLTMLIGGLVFFISMLILFIILDSKDEEKASFLLIPTILVVVLPYSITINNHPSKTTYQYRSEITLTNESQIHVYFNQFTQTDKEVIIMNYAEDNGGSWTSFKGYNIGNKKLIIDLTDNEGKFIYKDRITGQIYNENNIATQP
jgi:hypothetical protein